MGMDSSTPASPTVNTATPTTGATPTYNIPSYTNPFSSPSAPGSFMQAAQQTAQGNLAGAQAATAANRVNQSTPYGNLSFQQTGTDAQGNPIWSASQSLAPEFQGTLGNITNQMAQTYANPLNLQTKIGGTGMEGWDAATQLINQRLEPQIQRQSQALDAQLANQGIMPGSEAYNRAKTLQQQGFNDQRVQAQLAGSQVQNQMFNQNLQAGQFGNQAALANYQAPMSALQNFRTATTPNYVNPYSQAAVAGPDYLGAFTTQNASDIAKANANTAAKTAFQSGLFGLGGAALMGGTGQGSVLGGLANLGASGLNWLGNNSWNTAASLPIDPMTGQAFNLGSVAGASGNAAQNYQDWLTGANGWGSFGE